MKTVLIFDECGQSQIQFAVVDGDWTEFNHVYVNTYESTKSDELCAKLYDDFGNFLLDLQDDFPTQAVIDGAPVVVVGCLP